MVLQGGMVKKRNFFINGKNKEEYRSASANLYLAHHNFLKFRICNLFGV